jgi:mannose/fructose/N-acetylgalactosamine-specific phosphotransferase system component IIC
MRESLVVGATLAVFLAGAFQHPWWIPPVVALAAGWGYARVVSEADRPEATGPLAYAQAVISQLVNLYAAFGLGWLVAALFA